MELLMAIVKKEVDLAKEIVDFVESCDVLALGELYSILFNVEVLPQDDFETFLIAEEPRDNI
jgi:hypothetical protein